MHAYAKPPLILKLVGKRESETEMELHQSRRE